MFPGKEGESLDLSPETTFPLVLEASLSASAGNWPQDILCKEIFSTTQGRIIFYISFPFWDSLCLGPAWTLMNIQKLFSVIRRAPCELSRSL